MRKKKSRISLFPKINLQSLRTKTVQYWLRLTLFFFITLTIALMITPILIGSLSMIALLYAPCADPRHIPTDYGLEAKAIDIPAQNGTFFRGYFISGTNGATVIMPPPFASGRNARLPEAAMLAHHGYAVLLFESRRCAGLGPLSLGYREVDDVAAVLDYLATQPDINYTRLGIYGFSSAGATSIMAAAKHPQLRAVVAEGGYGDFAANAIGQNDNGLITRYFLNLNRWGMNRTYSWVTGLDIKQLSPVSVIDQIAPRPILLIYGSREASLVGGRQQLAAAGSNAALWVVEGAGHGNYRTVAPKDYETRIVAFFDQALLSNVE